MRMTRAALRAQAQDGSQLVFEDPDADSFHTSPEADATSDSLRPALKDITTEANPANNEDPFLDEQVTPMTKTKTKKVGRNAKQDKAEDEPVQDGQKVEQDAETSVVSQVQTVDKNMDSHTLSADETELVHHGSPMEPTEKQDTNHTRPDSTPQRTTPDAPLKTPKFDPEVHKAVEETATPPVDHVEDSFVEKITSRTPGRVLSFQENKSPDTFPEKINSRTPRIEESIEAIDALEDALERVAETLPALDNLNIESPVKSRKSTPLKSNTPTMVSSKKSVPTPSRTQRVSPAKIRPAPTVPTQVKPTAARQSLIKPIVKPPVASKPVKKPVVDDRKPRQSSALAVPPTLSFSNSPAKSLPNMTKKRVPSETLSTSRPAFVPAKSTKAPTKSTFQLPGEAISAKLKAQREERLKREEEAEKEKKTFKARPVPTKVARPSVLPRENKASQARMSIYANGIDKENVAPKPTIPSQSKQRPTSLDAKRKISDLIPTKANSSVRRTTTTTIISKPRISSLTMTTGQKQPVTKVDVAQQKAKGKEVFGRSKADLEKMEKERKEKEEATKKARAEAAERGRQASREWAEKQKKKIAAQTKDKILAVAVTTS